MCACEPGYTCPRCAEPDDLFYDDREREEAARYEARLEAAESRSDRTEA